MIKSIQVVWVLSVLALDVSSPRPPAPTGPICSGFSEEQEHRSPALSWRFRWCTSADGQKELQVQFRNRSNELVKFEFRLWTERLRSCRSDAPPSARGLRVLGPNETEEWPYTISPLDPTAEFTGRIWVCVKEVAR